MLACLLAASTELLKFLFSMLEGADVLLESDNLAQLKQEYNISGSARSPISASGGAAAASARREELWARYPFLQVWVRCALLPLQLCASEQPRHSLADSACACACACVRLCVVVVRCLSGHLAGMHGGGRAGERVAWHGDQRLTRDPGGRGDAHARQERATRAPGLTVADTVMLRNSNDSLLEWLS